MKRLLPFIEQHCLASNCYLPEIRHWARPCSKDTLDGSVCVLSTPACTCTKHFAHHPHSSQDCAGPGVLRIQFRRKGLCQQIPSTLWTHLCHSNMAADTAVTVKLWHCLRVYGSTHTVQPQAVATRKLSKVATGPSMKAHSGRRHDIYRL